MTIETFINVRPYQTRAICAEKGKLKQIFYHRSSSPSLVGALYKGKVIKIVKSLNYAFVDLGLERSGFLYGKDLAGPIKDVSKILKTGQKVLIQVKADPLRNKGVRLSMEIGLAGLFLLYLPEQKPKVTLSRQITSPDERKRLNTLVADFDTKTALIVRTFAEGQNKKSIEKDFLNLKQHWQNIQSQFEKQTLLGQIQQGEDPLLAFLKDILSLKPGRFVIDDKDSFKKVVKWLKAFQPDLAKKVTLYTEERALFENFKLESQVQKSQQKKVSLKNGGFLIFEELEAFSVIDVNSGRFYGAKSLSRSILELNLEAAKVIAEQVRLRHLGGIILVDFIDMEEAESGEKVVACMEKCFKGDKSHPKVFPMGELGMVQITRKRSYNSLSHFMTEVCPSCKGLGRKKTLSSIAIDLFLKIEAFHPPVRRLFGKKQKLQVLCHSELKKHIEEKEQPTLEFLKKRFSFQLEKSDKTSLENFRIEKL